VAVLIVIDEPIFLGKEIARHKDYSEETAGMIDTAIRRILEASMTETKEILEEHRDQLVTIAETLFQKETLDDREIRELIGFPPLTKDESEETDTG
ncbi:MAG: cell division protein FtsH, partial [bacterium]